MNIEKSIVKKGINGALEMFFIDNFKGIKQVGYGQYKVEYIDNMLEITKDKFTFNFNVKSSLPNVEHDDFHVSMRTSLMIFTSKQYKGIEKHIKDVLDGINKAMSTIIYHDENNILDDNDLLSDTFRTVYTELLLD